MKSFYGKPKKPTIDLLMFSHNAIRSKAEELVKEHIYMKMIDDGYDPYIISNEKMTKMVRAFLCDTGEMFFDKARMALEKAKH